MEGRLVPVVTITRASSIITRSSVLISVSGDTNNGTQPLISDASSF
jgi:hypothetical protein